MLYFSRSENLEQMDLYVATRNGAVGSWGTGTALSSINSDFDDMGTSISSSGNILYFFSNRPTGDDWDIYTSSGSGTSWGNLEKLDPPVNTSDNERWPWISRDDNTLYFDSDRPNGKGGFNLWKAERRGWYGNAVDNFIVRERRKS